MATTVPPFPYERRRNVTDRRTGPMPRAVAQSVPVHDPVARDRAEQAARFSLRTAAAYEGMRVSWGGVWGGVLSAVGLLLLLGALGIAVGVTAADPRATDASTAGTAAAIWVGASLLIALFTGGVVSTRAGAIHDRATGFWEGFLVWIVSLILVAWLATSGMTSLASGAMQLTGVATQATQAAQPGPAPAPTSTAPTPPATAPTVDPNAAVAQLKERVQQATGSLAQRAAEAQPAATRAAWITFGGLVLSLAAAIAGALLGRRRFPGFAR